MLGLSAEASGPRVPTLTRAIPTLGRGAPTLGPRAPMLGRGAPTLGPRTPMSGRGAPTLGPRAPTLGRGAPTLGPRAQPLGRPARSLGNCSHSLGQPSRTSGKTASPSGQATSPGRFHERRRVFIEPAGAFGTIGTIALSPRPRGTMVMNVCCFPSRPCPTTSVSAGSRPLIRGTTPVVNLASAGEPSAMRRGAWQSFRRRMRLRWRRPRPRRCSASPCRPRDWRCPHRSNRRLWRR